MGAEVTGLDPAAESIAVARAHAEATGARLAYRAGLVEDLVAEGARFDVVTALEVVEHVADLRAFVAAAAALAKPGGLILASTLNRTLKSFALAIVGAEYVLGWVGKGTHRWEQFVTPEELAAALEAAGCRETARRGVVYDLPRRDWRLSSDVSVNYFMAARKLSGEPCRRDRRSRSCRRRRHLKTRRFAPDATSGRVYSLDRADAFTLSPAPAWRRSARSLRLCAAAARHAPWRRRRRSSRRG